MNRMRQYRFTLYWAAAFLYWEILTHGAMYGAFGLNFRYAIGFSVCFGIIMSTVTGCLKPKWEYRADFLLTALMLLLYGSQMVYFFIFRAPYSIGRIGLGAGAVTAFRRETLSAMWEHFPWLTALAQPMILLVAIPPRQEKERFHPLLPGIAAALLAVTCADIALGGREMFSDFYFFTSSMSTTQQSAERFGLGATGILELTRPVFSRNTALRSGPKAAASSSEDNVLDVDLGTVDPSQKTISDYISGLTPTRKNEYTGIFRDYNLIVICAESFSPAAVDPEITPTLYRLTHEGFVFENFFTTFSNVTTDGEYTLLQGLFPDPKLDKYSSSMLASKNHTLPFTLASRFREELGVSSFGYHNYTGSYYDRRDTHTNLGYQMKFAGDGMTFTNAWPASDLEMMEQSVDDYIHLPQFHAYYMTFSGHYRYDFETNAIARGNRSAVKDLPGKSEMQKAYLACQMELDKAMEYLLRRLEQAGIAEKTLIVLTADHTPYGLTEDNYFRMIGKEKDFFEWYRSPLIFRTAGMQPKTIAEYCCTADLLPTLLNLWGFSYDSRMLAGTDIFSDADHIAVLSDHSFLTDRVYFRAGTGEARWQTDEIDKDYVNSINEAIAKKFTFSAEVLKNDYYRYLPEG